MPSEPTNPYAPPLHEPPSRGEATHARTLGPLLIVGNAATFPAVCVKCGTTDALTSRRQTFVYAPAWTRLFGVLLLALLQKRSRFELPICAPCNARWKRWNGIAVLALIAPVGMLWISLSIIAAPTNEPGSTTSLLAIPAALLGLAAIFRLRQRHVVIATRVDRVETWLRGVHERAMQAATHNPQR